MNARSRPVRRFAVVGRNRLRLGVLVRSTTSEALAADREGRQAGVSALVKSGLLKLEEAGAIPPI
jgi:hypothetical protein